MSGRGGSVGPRGQSAPLGVVLVLTVMIVSTTAVVALGADAIASTQSQLDAERTNKVLTQLDSQAALVALGQSEVQRVDLSAVGSNRYRVVDGTDGGEIRVEVDGVATPIIEQEMGKVVYEGEGGTRVAYQGGGVWRTNADGQGVMVSPPELHYRNATLTLPLVTISGDSSLSGQATVTDNGSMQAYPNATLGRTNPLQSGRVNVVVQSEYYRAWGEYFEERTDGGVAYDHVNEEVTLTLSVPATNPPVAGGIVSGAPGTSMTIKNNAEADSYNSSNGDYSATVAEETRIITAGDVVVENNAVIKGSLEAGGDVDIDNNGEIRGNLSYGGTASGGGYPGGVDGWDAQNASVTSPDSVELLIDNRRVGADDSSENDNDDPSVDIDESTNTLENCGSTCEVTAGTYYLDSMSVPGTLRIDSSGGPVNIVVDGDVTLPNNANIEVVGGNRVNLYVEGDVTYGQNAYNSVTGDEAPNFWVYTNPGASATFDNNAVFVGVLYGPGDGTNPGTSATLNNNAHVYGGIVGDVSFVSNNYGVHYDEALTNVQSVQNARTIPALTYLHVSVNRVNVTAS
ncbi:hypothetical protein [Haloarcula sp. JP-L23]|uniref:DUF7289 family protein n=1 Tax=Haloarcula sp. JP-L23 TaxID=2716717 RepID=UPI001D043992